MNKKVEENSIMNDKGFDERVAQGVWNQFCYLADGLHVINNEISILLVISSVFFAFYSYCVFSNQMIFILPLIGFATVYILALFCIIPQRKFIPWVTDKNIDFDNLRKKKDVVDFYKQLITETYKYEYDVVFIFSRKKKIIMFMIIILIISTFFPLIPISYQYSPFSALIPIAFIDFLCMFFILQFDKNILMHFESGETPGKGQYICLYCRKTYEIEEDEKLEKCQRCGENEFTKNYCIYKNIIP